ncbi:hypothetical protein BCR35DRAFT_333538 [Leucosporidium creatinivorum]|uniref:F-box domain-containing protein n=1 Tax=Leucosporidium creatinivorum TaxID=106004 RepID=A0A1Y2EQL4_9BASI|nr:hypothetical protein BCR35DRAFT_333538 [Leucosporidium creatinivorum]
MDEALASLDELSTRRVKSLYLGTRLSFNSEELKEVKVYSISLPQSVNKIVVSNLRLQLCDLPSFVELKRLCLRWVDLGSWESWPSAGLTLTPSAFATPQLGTLESLTLLDVFLYSESFPLWTTWLTPTLLPLLRRLTLGLTGSGTKLGEEENLRLAVSRLAPQLTSFALVQGGSSLGVTDTFPWTAFTALQHLALYPQNSDPSALITFALHGIPRALSLLRIGDTRNLSDFDQLAVPWQKKVCKQLVAALEEDSPSLRKLERLVLESGTAEIGEKAKSQISKLRHTMLERGGCLEARVGWGGEKGQLSWERFLEPW